MWNPKTFWQGLERILIWLLGVTATWQLRHTFYFDLLGGAYFEYGSIHIYVSDLILVGLLICWLVDSSRNQVKLGPKPIFWSLIVFLVWQTASTFWAADKTAALWHAGGWWLWLGGYLYVINRVKKLSELLWPLGFGLALQAGIGIAQYFHNGSLGLTFLGESILNISESGAPVVLKDGLHQLRAHGLVPHANILGGLLAVGFGWMAALGNFDKRHLRWTGGIMAITALGLFLAFSRIAWVAWLVVSVVGLILAIRSQRLVKWGVMFGILVWLVALVMNWHLVFGRFDVSSPLESKSVDDRIESIQIFEKVWSSHRWFGVGAGNYIQAVSQMDELPRPAWTYQVVPNIYLLVLAELGLVGALAWLAVLLAVFYQIWVSRSRVSWWLASGVGVWLATGLVDHWPMSLHQGWVLWFLALALIILSDRLEYKDATK